MSVQETLRATRFCVFTAIAIFTSSLFALNTIQIENAKAGTTAWQLTNPATGREIEGYASLTSVNRGGTIAFFVNTSDSSYTIDIYRMGWYGGTGGRSMMSTITLTGMRQPDPIIDSSSGMVECNWNKSYSLSVPYNASDPSDWASGFYLAKLTGKTSGKQSYIIFVVRDDARASTYLLQSSVTTYQAYNNWGGKSLYGWNSTGGGAGKVSFNRPYAPGAQPNAAIGVGAGDFLTNVQLASETAATGWEYPMVRFLEREGYDVSYATSVDTHENPQLLLSHKAFLSVGHDEYWSWQMRQNLENSLSAGVSLGFFSSNAIYWQIRLEPSPISGAADRTIECHKESALSDDPYAIDGDLSNDYLITTRFRDPPVNRPEDALIGVMYYVDPVNADMVIDDATNWTLKGTNLFSGSHITGAVGYEADRMFGHAPVGTARIATSPAGGQNANSTTYFATNSGAVVFATGSMQWSWTLDDLQAPAFRPSVLSSAAQQITRNVLARFAASPPGMVPRTNWSLKFVDSQETSCENGRATNSFDGNTSTYWHTQWCPTIAPLPHEIQIDLGASYRISGFRYLPREDGGTNGRVGQYEFYVSTDGIWGVPTVTGSLQDTAAESEVLFPQVVGRYVRLRALSEVHGKPFTSMGEMRVLGVTSSSNQPPDGSITQPTGDITVNVGTTVNFAGSGTDPDNNIPLSYLWSFGSGSGISDSSQQNPSVVFNTPGTYTVTMTVTDTLGASDPTPATRTVTVVSPYISSSGWALKYVDSQETSCENGRATNSFDANSSTFWHTQWCPTSAPLPHEIQIDLGATYSMSAFAYLPRQDGGTHGRIAQYEFYVSADGTNWGTPVSTGTLANVATEQQVRFAAANGRYIRLRALSEVNGNPWTSMAELRVAGSVVSSNQSPNGTITSPGSDLTVSAGSTVSFAGSGTDPDNNTPFTYLWNFGAGSGIPNSTLQNPGNIVFNTPGIYTVTLTVTDALGASDPTPAARTITVTSPYISPSAWVLKYVDSQETSCENGKATNSFDSNSSTYWHTQWCPTSAPLPHEIQIDLGATYSIGGFSYVPRQDGGTHGRIAQYEFYVSADGTNWGIPVSTGTLANVATEQQVRFTAAAGRYIRLRALSEVNGNPWTSMAELKVLGTK